MTPEIFRVLRQNIADEIRGQILSSGFKEDQIEDFNKRMHPFVIGYVFGYVIGRRTSLEALSGKTLGDEGSDSLFDDVVIELFGEENGKRIVGSLKYIMMDYRWPEGMMAAANDTLFALEGNENPTGLRTFLNSNDY